MDFTSKYVHVDGIRTHYLEAGAGQAVLLLHSGEFGASAELSWERTIPTLAKRYRVVAPDWLGYGNTDKLYDFGGGQGRMLAHLRRFMQIMELEESDVVGNSMGGGLLSRAIAGDRDAFRIRSLTLIAAGGFNPDNEHRRAMMNYDCTIEGMRALISAMFVAPEWSNDAYVRRRHTLSIQPGAWETVAAARFKNPITPSREFFGRTDETPYGNLTMPVLIIAGDQDKLRLPGWEIELARKIPGSESHVVQNTGHCPHLEEPEQVNGLILDFLARIHR